MDLTQTEMDTSSVNICFVSIENLSFALSFNVYPHLLSFFLFYIRKPAHGQYRYGKLFTGL